MWKLFLLCHIGIQLTQHPGHEMTPWQKEECEFLVWEIPPHDRWRWQTGAKSVLKLCTWRSERGLMRWNWNRRKMVLFLGFSEHKTASTTHRNRRHVCLRSSPQSDTVAFCVPHDQSKPVSSHPAIHLPTWQSLSLSLQGPTGPVGETGIPGPQGPQGPQGPSGRSIIGSPVWQTHTQRFSCPVQSTLLAVHLFYMATYSI